MKQDVLRLDVPMDDVVVVHEVKGVADLLNDPSDLLFLKATFLLQLVIEVASWTVLQHQVEVLLVVEESVQLSYIWMLQVALDLDLTCQLSNVFLVVLKNGLFDLLESADESGNPVPE